MRNNLQIHLQRRPDSVSPRSQPGAAAAQRHQGTTRLGPLGVRFPSYTLLLAPSPLLRTPAHFAHMQCNNQTLGLQGTGPGGCLGACEPSQENVMRRAAIPQDTHLHRRQLSTPGCQWQHQRSCRCRPLRCPSSPPPRCTGARCKAPWSARAWLGKRRRERRFPGDPAVASPALQTPGQGQDKHAGWEGGGWCRNGQVPGESKSRALRCWWE